MTCLAKRCAPGVFSRFLSSRLFSSSFARVVELRVSPNKVEKFHGIWLRDNCRCEQCLHPIAQQRLLNTSSLSLNIGPTWMQWEDESGSKVEDGSEGVNVRMLWPDGHESIFSKDFLAQHSYYQAETLARRRGFAGRKLWQRDDWKENDLPRVNYMEIADCNSGGLTDFVSKLRTHGFAFVDGTPATNEATTDLANLIGVTRKTVFGDIWDFTSNWQHTDTAYSSLEIGLHNDTTYFENAAGFQMFHCLHFEGTGGVSSLVDGFRVAKYIREEHSEAFKVLTTIPIRYQYLNPVAGENFQNLTTPIVLGQDGEIVEVRFNNSDRAPTCVAFSDMPAVYEAMLILLKALEDPTFQLSFTLKPGSPLIFDNRRVLHARSAFEGSRRICGTYWNRDDVMSSLRAKDIIKPMEDW